ncbi:MAG: Rpn family recombination-promoting nuclease/putative transposase [Clostridiales bacterium]|nr:Rpn family recombination-promoting nuclease/putative transposase [Clostridiales bacterium]
MGIISPKYDYCMKELFSNEVIRRHFISEVTGIPVGDIRSARLANTFLWRRYRKQKQGIMDVLVEMNDDTKVNIELQVTVFKNWDKRNLFYLAKMYTDDLRTGDRYGRLKRCICISILDFDYTGSADYHTNYRLRDRKGNDFSDQFEIHIIELRKKLDDTDLSNWIRLFNAESEEDLNMITTKNPGITEAIQEVRIMSLGKRMRLRYEAHLKEVRDRNAREEYVRDEGIEQGIEQGAEQKLISLIEGKLALDQSVDQIAEDLLETPERIRELMAQIRKDKP